MMSILANCSVPNHPCGREKMGDWPVRSAEGVMRRWVRAVRGAGVCAVRGVPARTPAATRGVRVEVSFPASVHAGPVTGRVYVMVSRTNDREPRGEAGRDEAPGRGAGGGRGR